MRLSNFKNFKSEMVKNNLLRQEFIFEYNGKTIDVMYFVDDKPNVLIIAVKGTSFGFCIEISDNFYVNDYIEVYGALCKALGIEYNNLHHFRSIYLWEMVNNNVPTAPHAKKTAKLHARFSYAHNVEEADKIYFCGWRDNTSAGGSMTNENYLKTKLAFGKETADICRRKNISSRWSDLKEKSVEFFRP